MDFRNRFTGIQLLLVEWGRGWGMRGGEEGCG